MVYQKNTKKLEPRWRGPFRISGYGGSHGKSFEIQQQNGRKIRGAFHGNHLKTYTPRRDYLTRPSDQSVVLMPQQQTIRRPRRQRG